MKSKIEKDIERMEIKMDLILDILKEVSQPKYYCASNKTEPINSQDQEEELTDKKKAIDKGVDRKDTPEEWEERYRRDGALAFYTELEDWLYERRYAKDGEIRVPTKAFMQFVARELKLNNKKK